MAHKAMCAKCSQCQQLAPGYDRSGAASAARTVGIPTYFLYAPQRVECPKHGVVVEQDPAYVLEPLFFAGRP